MIRYAENVFACDEVTVRGRTEYDFTNVCSKSWEI
jgi:hypothetical protein